MIVSDALSELARRLESGPQAMRAWIESKGAEGAAYCAISAAALTALPIPGVGFLTGPVLIASSYSILSGTPLRVPAQIDSLAAGERTRRGLAGLARGIGAIEGRLPAAASAGGLGAAARWTTAALLAACGALATLPIPGTDLAPALTAAVGAAGYIRKDARIVAAAAALFGLKSAITLAALMKIGALP